MLYKRIDVAPLSVIQFKAYIKSGEKGIKAYSFLSFYNSQHKLLLTYKSNAIDSTAWQETGNYTETPAGAKYAEIGVENDSSGRGYVYADDFSIETNIGVPKIKHAPICNLDQYMKPFWRSDTVYNETVLLFSVNGKCQQVNKLLFMPDKIISVKKLWFKYILSSRCGLYPLWKCNYANCTINHAFQGGYLI